MNRLLLGVWLLFFPIAHLESLAEGSLNDAKGPEVNWTFNPVGVKRDPFRSPVEEGDSESNELLHVDVNEITLVGILSGMGPPQAMLVLPNGNTHIVQVRDRIGRNHGTVHKITSGEMIVKESFKDFQGRMQEGFAHLTLPK